MRGLDEVLQCCGDSPQVVDGGFMDFVDEDRQAGATVVGRSLTGFDQ